MIYEEGWEKYKKEALSQMTIYNNEIKVRWDDQLNVNEVLWTGSNGEIRYLFWGRIDVWMYDIYSKCNLR